MTREPQDRPPSESRTGAAASWPTGFWPVYAGFWLLYFLGYGSALAFTIDAPWHQGLEPAVANLAPQALAGLAVVRATRRWSGTRAVGRRWLLRHALALVVFAAVAVVGSWLLFELFAGLQSGRFELRTPSHLGPLAWIALTASLLYLLLAGGTHVTVLSADLRRAEARRNRLAALRARAELDALRRRIEPHFLFNALQTVVALIRRDRELAEEAVERLGDLLRYVLREEAALVPLEREWRFVEDYLAIERLRLGERLRCRMRATPEALATPVPQLCLQPLVENAIRHGIAPCRDGGRLTVTAARGPDSLAMRVTNGTCDPTPSVPERDHGVGLASLGERLRRLFGDRGSLAVDAGTDRFSVTVRIPITEPAA